jgi:hypothetical protein
VLLVEVVPGPDDAPPALVVLVALAEVLEPLAPVVVLDAPPDPRPPESATPAQLSARPESTVAQSMQP